MAAAKTLNVVKNDNGSYGVQWNERGGVIPNELMGIYTSPAEAQKAIQVFQAKVQEKVSARK